MNTHRRVGPIVSDGQITSEQRLSRIRTLKIFGGLHIGLGLVCGILCVIGTILSVRGKDIQCYIYSDHGYYHDCQQPYFRMLWLIMFLVSAAFSGWVSNKCH